jgi:micrococcal nuclease
MRRLILLAVAVLVVLLAGGGALRLGDDPQPQGVERDAGRAQVIRVVDGDTILVRIDGRRERVRYIGIDSPESVAPGRPVACYGHAASEENARLIGGRTVTLTVDEERRDRYGRLLAYVRREPDGLFVNEELVRGGFATTLEVRPNLRYAGHFRDLEREARARGRGLWGACDR